ncbi:MAG: HlyD family secretion protein [Bacteroidales bacterium]
MINFRIAAIIFVLLHFAGCNISDNGADAWGNFEARETIISAQTQGKLMYLDTERGQMLENNIQVGLIDTIQYALNYKSLLAKKESVNTRLKEIDANIAVLETQKANLEREFNRAKKLLKDQAATQQQVEELEGKIQVMESQVLAARTSKNTIIAELQAMDAQIALAREQWDKCIVMNPVRGTVLEKYAENHELVMPGKALYKIADLSEMELKVYVSGSQLPHISLGQKAQVFIDEDEKSNRAMEGTVSWISSRAEFTPKTIQTKEERVNQVYAVNITVPNDGSIKIGMPGEVVF